MYLAGLFLTDEDVRALALLVDETTRSLLDRSLLADAGIVSLTVDDRARILRALDYAPTEALRELRGVLRFEREWQGGDELLGG